MFRAISSHSSSLSTAGNLLGFRYPFVSCFEPGIALMPFVIDWVGVVAGALQHAR